MPIYQHCLQHWFTVTQTFHLWLYKSLNLPNKIQGCHKISLPKFKDDLRIFQGSFYDFQGYYILAKLGWKCCVVAMI